MKKLLFSLVALALCSSLALANIPDPPRCTVTPCDALQGVIMGPDTPAPIPSSVVTMVIRNNQNLPINNAAVNITFGSGLCMCASMVFNTTTNAQGQATMTMRGGGCLDNVADAAVIRANGTIIRSYRHVNSPDWAPGCDRRIILSDLVRFGCFCDPCHDYDNNGTNDLADVVVFASAYGPSHSCN